MRDEDPVLHMREATHHNHHIRSTGAALVCEHQTLSW